MNLNGGMTQAIVSMVMKLLVPRRASKYSQTLQRLTSADGIYCKLLVKNTLEDTIWTQENNVVKKLGKLGLDKNCNIHIILLLRGLTLWRQKTYIYVIPHS